MDIEQIKEIFSSVGAKVTACHAGPTENHPLKRWKVRTKHNPHGNGYRSLSSLQRQAAAIKKGCGMAAP